LSVVRRWGAFSLRSHVNTTAVATDDGQHPMESTGKRDVSAHDAFRSLKQQMSRSIIGQDAVIDRVLIALLANGHVLMEGLPGLAKTRTIKTLAEHLEADFSRIQFTPDLLPADVTGTEVYYTDSGKGTFQFQPGPVFGNI